MTRANDRDEQSAGGPTDPGAQRAAFDRALFHAIADSGADAVIAYDTDCRVVQWSTATARNTGISREDAVGRTVQELFPYIRGTPVEQEYLRSLQGETVDGRERSWTPTGQERPRHYDVTYVPVRDEAGTVLGGAVMTRDVTSRRESEESLAEERRLLRTILDTSPHVLIAVDTALLIVEWNACAERQSGMRRSDVVHRPLLDVLPDIAGTVVLQDYQAAASGALRHIRNRWYARPGESPRCYDVVFAPMHDGRGATTGGVMIAQDVTDRARAEAALGDERALLRAILDATPQLIVAFDRELRYTEWNRWCEEHLGVARATALGSPLGCCLPWKIEVAARETRWQRVLAGAASERVVDAFQLPGRDGDMMLESTMSPLRSPDGTVIGGVLVGEDVTERMRAEQERNRLFADLDAARDRAERASQAKSAMLAGLSHELRTPLGAVIGFTQLLRDGGGLTAIQSDYVSDVLAGAGHLLRVVNDALDLARVEAGAVELRPETADVAALVADAVSAIEAQATADAIAVHMHVDDDARRAKMDPVRFRQMLLNYLSNAVKYNVPGGRVDVSVTAERAGYIHVAVRDTGPGIPYADMGRLFVEFQRLTTDRDIPGSGLGLAITKRLAEAMGGSVYAESTPGEGSTFHLLLPQERP